MPSCSPTSKTGQMWGMAQRGDCLRFPLEPLLQIGISRDMLGKHLDGNGPVQAGVAGFVDFAHAPGAEGGFDLVGAKPSSSFKGHRLRRHPIVRAAQQQDR